MKRKIIILSLAFLSAFTWSCDSFLDVNQDPNVLNNIPDEKVLMPAAEIGLANQLMGWDFGFGGAFWVEYWTQKYSASQFKSLCEYSETSFGSAYSELTAGVLNDLERMKQVSETSTDKGNYYVAEALQIFTWQILTDVWGNVPYFEALKGNTGVLSPKFDDGKVIYADLMTRIDALLAMDISAYSVDKKYDFMFAGDLTKWKAFATSLKLKLMMRVSETADYNNASVISFIEASTFLDISAKISGSVWKDDDEGKRHPMREFQEGGASNLSTNVIGSKNFIDYLDTNSDPRLETLFTKGGSAHLGAFFGDFDSEEDSDANGTNDDKEVYSQAKFEATTDLVVMSAWEINFYIAEAYARASNFTLAKSYYDKGVKASLSQHGISDDAIILAGGYAEWKATAVEEAIKAISMQRWVANAKYQHIESLLERNRTKYPAVSELDIRKNRNAAFNNFPVGMLTVSVAGKAKTNGFLPTSPIYPQSLLYRNTSAPAQKVDLLEKVWWNKKAGK